MVIINLNYYLNKLNVILIENILYYFFPLYKILIYIFIKEVKSLKLLTVYIVIYIDLIHLI